MIKTRNTFIGITASALLILGLATESNAATFVESNDYGDSFFNPTPLGMLSEGINTVTGSLFTTCVQSGGVVADCTSGDDIDAIEWTVADSFGISAASVSIINYLATGTLGNPFDIGFGRIGFVEWQNNGVYELDILDAFLDLNQATFEVASATSFTPFLQGTGDIGYDYVLTLHVTASPVPLPAGIWLFASALCFIAKSASNRGRDQSCNPG